LQRASAPIALQFGCDAVLDYTKLDFTKSNNHWDIIFDTVSNRSFGECKKVLTQKGVMINTLPTPSVALNHYLTGQVTSKTARTIWVKPNSADVEWIAGHMASGAIKVVIDHAFPFDQAKEALAASEKGKARGKIVIEMP